MTHTVVINEEKHPVKYGMNALRLFCEASNISLSDLEQLGNSMSLDHAINLVWAGLKDGARVEKKAFDLSSEDVADLIDEHPTLVAECIELFMVSFLKPTATEKK